MVKWNQIIFWSLTIFISAILLSSLYSNASSSGSVAVSAAGGTMPFNPVEDTYVRIASPTSNYGTSTTLHADAGTNEERTLIRFNTISLPINVQINRIQLSLYVTNSSATGGTLYETNGSWSANTVTWNTAPALGTKILDLPKATSGTRLILDIPLSFFRLDNNYSWYILTNNTDGVYYSSRETSNPPILTIEYGSSQTVTPTTTQASPTPTPRPQSTDAVIVAAGDIACDPVSTSFHGGAGSSTACHMQATANLIQASNPVALLALGDNQYYCGSYTAFMQSYDLSWGKFKNKTYPVVGNHEYITSPGTSAATGCDSTNTGASGYFTYFGTAAGQPGKGYYSYDIGNWHMIALNSNCGDAGGCGSTSAQYKWLENDLKTHQTTCTLAYYHIPLFSSGGRANANSKTLYKLLYDNNADVILTGHDHIYERFAPQTADGVRDDLRGIRNFVVGTGGANHTAIATIFPNSEIRNIDTYGVLKMTLHAGSYDWDFIPESGKTFTDHGSQICH